MPKRVQWQASQIWESLDQSAPHSSGTGTVYPVWPSQPRSVPIWIHGGLDLANWCVFTAPLIELRVRCALIRVEGHAAKSLPARQIGKATWPLALCSVVTGGLFDMGSSLF